MSRLKIHSPSGSATDPSGYRAPSYVQGSCWLQCTGSGKVHTDYVFILPSTGFMLAPVYWIWTSAHRLYVHTAQHRVHAGSSVLDLDKYTQIMCSCCPAQDSCWLQCTGSGQVHTDYVFILPSTGLMLAPVYWIWTSAHRLCVHTAQHRAHAGSSVLDLDKYTQIMCSYCPAQGSCWLQCTGSGQVHTDCVFILPSTGFTLLAKIIDLS